MELTLDIDEATYERLERRAGAHGFDSAEAYGAVVVETVLDELDGDEADDAVRDRLDDLGYL